MPPGAVQLTVTEPDPAVAAVTPVGAAGTGPGVTGFEVPAEPVPSELVAVTWNV